MLLASLWGMSNGAGAVPAGGAAAGAAAGPPSYPPPPFLSYSFYFFRKRIDTECLRYDTTLHSPVSHLFYRLPNIPQFPFSSRTPRLSVTYAFFTPSVRFIIQPSIGNPTQSFRFDLMEPTGGGTY